MEQIKCPYCGYDGEHKLCFNFDSDQLEQVQKGYKIEPRFRIKCVCGDCNKYIKFLPFKDNLINLHNKFIDY